MSILVVKDFDLEQKIFLFFRYVLILDFICVNFQQIVNNLLKEIWRGGGEILIETFQLRCLKNRFCFNFWTFNPDGHFIHIDIKSMFSGWIKCPSGLDVHMD